MSRELLLFMYVLGAISVNIVRKAVVFTRCRHSFLSRSRVAALALVFVWLLVLVDMTKASTLHVLQVKNDCGACMTVKSDILQSAHNTVQKTRSGAQLHRLSDGVEMLPVDMLRYGVLDVSRTEYTGDYGLECVYNCGDYALLLDGLGRVNGGYRN